MTTLYLFGDSLTKGIIYEKNAGRYRKSASSFSTRLESIPGLNVLNFSRMGLTIEGGLSLMHRHAGEPGYALVEFGGNDCDFAWSQVAANPVYAAHQCKVPPSRFTALYLSAIQYLRKMDISPILMNLPPIDTQRFFDHVSQGLDGDAILSFLATKQRIYTWQELYSSLTERVAAQAGCPLLDVRSLFLLQHDYRDYLCADGIHPSEDGHRLIADYVMDWAKDLPIIDETESA